MNSPTAKARNPKAVKLRWKLSVRCSTSVCAFGSRTESVGTSFSSGSRPERWFSAITIRLSSPSLLNSFWAKPMSMKAAPSSIRSETRSARSVCPRIFSAVAGETNSMPGGVMKESKSPAFPRSTVLVSAGIVSGSMPITLNRMTPNR
ncbi:hypothetical protein D9M72_396590 [compost metagenome]